MAIKFCPVASGSDGNCIFIGTDSTNILVDVGISGIEAEKGLKVAGISGSDIDGILITHEHSDHIKGAGVLSRRYNIPIFAMESVWDVFEKRDLIGKIAPQNKKFIYSEERSSINDIVVLPFSIPHDAVEPVGFSFFTQNKKITTVTDIGYITDSIKENAYDSDILLIECNHDVDMLVNGSYPWPLKKRILSDYGHLSNIACGEFLVEIMSSRLKHVYLGHLSQENNIPLLAYETVINILSSNKIFTGVDIDVSMALRRTIATALPTFV